MAPITLAQAWPAVLAPDEAQLLSGLQRQPVPVRPRQQILNARLPVDGLLYLSQGFVGRYRCDRLGRRQFMGIQIPGDFLDLPGAFMGRMDSEAEALGPGELQDMPPGTLQSLEATAPDILGKLWRMALIDGAISRQWIYRIGRLSGRARIASFFCEMLLRLHVRGLCTLDGFDLPLTQTDLGEVSGMTAVHVNRMLSELRNEGICTFTQGTVQIANLPELFHTARFDWNYLYLGAAWDQKIRRMVSGARHANRGVRVL